MKVNQQAKIASFAKDLKGPQTEKTMAARPPIVQDGPYEIVRGVRDDADDSVTPLKHVSMFLRQFTKENLEEAVLYIKTDGTQGAPPLFLSVDTRGSWSITADGRLFWKADDGTTDQLLVVAKEDVEETISKFWYKQDCPSGIFSLHKFLCKTHLGISRTEVSKFVKKQVAWQMIAPKKNKSKYRKSILAKRPFVMCEFDIADMISFGQTTGPEDYRYCFIFVDAHSGFIFSEPQADKTSETTLKSFEAVLLAIGQLGYDMPKFLKSDQGPEFQGPGWDRLDAQHKWRRELTKRYPATRAERAVRTFKTQARLNSRGLYGEDTKWWNVITATCLAINRIHNDKRGASPLELVVADRERHIKSYKDQKESRKAAQLRDYHQSPQEPNVGDSCRISLLGDKERGIGYKGHIAYDDLRGGVATKWSEQIHVVQKKRVNRNQGSVKLKVDGKWYFWPSGIQIVPADSVLPKTMGQDGNIEFRQPQGRRRSRRKKFPRR